MFLYIFNKQKNCAKLKCREWSRKNFFVVVENIQKRQLLVKFIGQCIPDGDGRGIARDIKKKLFSFSKVDKNCNKVWTV